jgi:4-amino-4-deoxy-L-arabinose transferase-like glycosyltransferase
MNKIQKISLISIIFLAFVLRFWKLGDISFGLHADEASQAYNAYSLIRTGKDMYGKYFPILFRANGSYQPPVYTYLTVIPVFLFGNTVFSAKFVSALSGVFLVLLSFYLWKFFGFGSKDNRILQGLLASLFVAVSPWSVHFSRLAVEGNLVVLIFAVALFFSLYSVSKEGREKYFLLACLFLGLSTHTYYTERVTSIIYLVFFIFLFRKFFLKNRKILIYGFFIFLISLLPHLYIAHTGALTRRLMQVSYLSDNKFSDIGLFQKLFFLADNFFSHYIDYFSPKNLFFNPGDDLGRVSPGLSVFYPLFFFLALLGLKVLLKNKENNFIKILSALIFITPIPAGLTGDAFYPLRVLTFLWVITNVISLGFYLILIRFQHLFIRSSLVILLLFYSLFFLYTSRLVLFKYWISGGGGSFPYLKFFEQLNIYKDKKVYLDRTDRSWGLGIVSAYILKAEPELIQNNLKSQLNTPYYSSEVNPYEVFVIDNLIVKPINWVEICGDNLILVGDKISVSYNQIVSHSLVKIFEINDIKGEPYLFGYKATKSCLNK